MTAKLVKTVLAGAINLGDYNNFRFEYDVALENGTVEEYVEGCGVAAKCLLAQAASSTNPLFKEKVREYVGATFGITADQVPAVPPIAPAATAPATAPQGTVNPTPASNPVRQPPVTQPTDPAARQPPGPSAPAPASPPPTAPSLLPGMQVVGTCPGIKGQPCGADVTKSQKDLSMLVCSKPLCKTCMAKAAGVT